MGGGGGGGVGGGGGGGGGVWGVGCGEFWDKMKYRGAAAAHAHVVLI